MIVIRRRLFWKVYLTLLASLVVVTMLMGLLWWLTGDSINERWGTFRIWRLAGSRTPDRGC